jgi:hypothetical protein
LAHGLNSRSSRFAKSAASSLLRIVATGKKHLEARSRLFDLIGTVFRLLFPLAGDHLCIQTGN